MKVRVDEQMCNGHGLCEMVAPEVYRVNPGSGFNEAGEYEVAPSLLALARDGANACPEHAIALLDERAP